MQVKRLPIETNQMCTMMSYGLALPYAARSVTTEDGISWNAAVFITTNSTMPRVGVSPPEIRCISSIAARPSGVAAFPMPSMFAAMFIEIFSPTAVCAAYSGNRRRISGERMRETFSVSPACDAMFISPSHRHIAPISSSAVSTALCAPSAAAFESAVRFPVAAAPKTARRMRTAQMEFSIPMPRLPFLRDFRQKRAVVRTMLRTPLFFRTLH